MIVETLHARKRSSRGFDTVACSVSHSISGQCYGYNRPYYEREHANRPQIIPPNRPIAKSNSKDGPSSGKNERRRFTRRNERAPVERTSLSDDDDDDEEARATVIGQRTAYLETLLDDYLPA